VVFRSKVDARNFAATSLVQMLLCEVLNLVAHGSRFAVTRVTAKPFRLPESAARAGYRISRDVPDFGQSDEPHQAIKSLRCLS
jgi:hypothetical protein